MSIFGAGRTWGLETITGEPWTARAACSPKTAEWFWPISKIGNADNRAALTICREHCPVRLQCATYAITHGEVEGIWGGMTEEDLRRARAQRYGQQPEPQRRTRTDGNCLRCAKYRELSGRGICDSCANVLSSQGLLGEYPPLRQKVGAR